jgi:ribosomal protein S18 acetylase RimI-like enzyme
VPAITETPFQPGALGDLRELWRQVMPDDAPDADRFRDLALLNPSFRPDGLIMLWRGSRLIGFGYAIAEAASSQSDPAHGWLAGLGVAPGERGAGHGSRLLESCLRFLADAGCRVARLGGNGERYLLPGCDATAYPEFRQLIRTAGFQSRGSTDGMACDLGGLTPTAVHDVPGGDDRFAYRRPGDADLPELLTVVAQFSSSWSGLVRSYLGRDSQGANLWIASGPDGIAGFAGADLFPGCPGRFGPIGVLPRARGSGIGTRLLRLSLDSMAEQGRRSAWFLWGPEAVAGRRMYESAGFRVNRSFEFFSRELRPSA